METNKEKNNKLVSSFLLSLEADNYSENTIRSYRTGINQFMEFYGDRDFLDVDYPDAEDYKNSLYISGKSSNTISLRIAPLREFSKYVRKRVRKTYPQFENVFEDLTLPPKKNKKEKIIWKPEELIELSDKLWNAGKYTESCLVALDLYSGRRRSELRSFSVEDFQDNKLICDGKLYQSDAIKTKGRNGGKYIQCYIDSKIKAHVRKYVEKFGITSGLLFPNVTDSTMGCYMETINKYTDKHFHWHAGRHTFATSLYDEGVPDDIIVELVGWSSANMLKVYNDNTREQKIKKFFA